MNKDTIIRLRSLPIEDVAGRLGLSVNRHKCLCPFHDDHHASLSFCTSRNTFRCFVCGASGGTIDLTMRYLGKSFPEACRWLADRHNIVVLPIRLPLLPIQPPKSLRSTLRVMPDTLSIRGSATRRASFFSQSEGWMSVW